MNTRHLSRRAALIGLASMASATVAAQAPMKIIVPWAPGGSTDAIARVLAQRMTESQGRTVIVDNRPGAAGKIGTEAGARAAPDGSTLLLVELPHAIAPAVTLRLPYAFPRDFAPITLVGTTPLILFTNADASAPADLRSFMARARGKSPLALAHSGPGTVSHLASELLAARSGVTFTLVPYKGSAPALVDVAGGVLAGHFSSLAAGAPLLGAGKLRALAVTSATRLPQLPDVPTLAELGVPDVAIDQWWALVGPAQVPAATLDKIRADAVSAIGHPATRDKLSSLGVVLRTSTREDLAAFMQAEVQRWGTVARSVGLKPE